LKDPVPPRKIQVNDIHVLKEIHQSKNRHYTQLFSGQLSAHFSDANLDNLQIMRESFNVGAQVEAAPPAHLLPFGFIPPTVKDFNFCGYKPQKNSFVQASGGKWDVSFKQKFDYIGTVFDKKSFISGYEALTGTPFMESLTQSKISLTTEYDGMAYAVGVCETLEKLHRNTQLINEPHIVNLLSSNILKLTINALVPSIAETETLKPLSKRIKGVKHVIDYLQVSVHELPNMQTLCTIANLSERTLQYGFLEYIGLTPIEYMRVLRLNHVNFELKLATSKTKITDIALKWGFIELGRFARDYKSLFLELPSDTLMKK
jgi:AraC family ethanolamine operon transcriptional activator